MIKIFNIFYEVSYLFSVFNIVLGAIIIIFIQYDKLLINLIFFLILKQGLILSPIKFLSITGDETKLCFYAVVIITLFCVCYPLAYIFPFFFLKKGILFCGIKYYKFISLKKLACFFLFIASIMFFCLSYFVFESQPYETSQRVFPKIAYLLENITLGGGVFFILEYLWNKINSLFLKLMITTITFTFLSPYMAILLLLCILLKFVEKTFFSNLKEAGFEPAMASANRFTVYHHNQLGHSFI